ncbi:MAG TPA: VOC family protein [Baekduia sp.]|nr:VOC family protein [Baekduia sp.]
MNVDQTAVIGIDHVGFSCADLDGALEFFCDVLGVPLRTRGELVGGSAGEAVDHPELRGRYADLDLGDGHTLELFEIAEPRGEPITPDALRPGGGHCALRVRDIDDLVARVIAAGYEPVAKTVQFDEPGFWSGARVVYVRGPGGIVIELIERAADSSYSTALTRSGPAG